MEDKLKEIIDKIVREEIMGEATKSMTIDYTDANKGDKIINVDPSDKETIDAIKKDPTVKAATLGNTSIKEMARAAEVKYSLKPDFRGDLENVRNKLSDAEFRSLVDIVKVLKDEGKSLTATDILRIHNEKNPDVIYNDKNKRIGGFYASQQSFIRPLVIGAIGKKKITYDELPFTASQKDVSTGYEKATGVVTPSQNRGSKFSRDIEYTAASQADPDYMLPADRAELAAKTLDYKRARESYRKADNAAGKQQYVDKMQAMVANDDELGQEIAQQYADGLIQTQDPVTLELAKKFRITKKKYGIPKISDKETRDAAAIVGAEDAEAEV
jgi:hypothetical protein